MKNPSIHLGFTLLSDHEEGNKKVAGFTGHMIGGVDTLQATILQDLLLSEFKDDLDKFLTPILERLVELGYAGAASAGVSQEVIESAKQGIGKKTGNSGNNVR